MSLNKILYLPVETAARELDAKLLMALFASGHGFKVIVGSHVRIHNRIHQFTPGIYIGHLFNRRKKRIFSILRDLGFAIAAWDEEGLAWINAETYSRRRVCPQTLAMVERVYAWGEQQAEAMGDIARKAGLHIKILGNPRQDILSPLLRPLHAERAARLQRELGDFILFNSNFGWINHARNPRVSLTRTDEELTAIAALSGHDESYVRFRYEIFRAFCRLLTQVAQAMPERTIVVRPHPSENHEIWRQATQGLKNVVIRADADLVPWLMAAGAMIHNGCTTAVESALLDKPSIMYRPIDGGKFEIRQPLETSILAETGEEVLALLRKNQPPPEAIRRIHDNLSSMVAQWNRGLASERIARDLEDMFQTANPQASLPLRLRGQLHARARAMVKAYKARFSPKSSSNPAYIDQKFPHMDIREIRTRLETLARLVKLPTPDVQQLDSRLWRVTPPRP